ncbi:hypothetical protein SAMN05428954_0200 [Streptomyces sp. 2112.3]|uniref:hypothetical protein n=1 Tax=Streptomyces sp. 2112.3 TaxID=1881023 RepID=UPI000899D74B|nr:hypothetical protein [Streptomyces sp. 2112.3]SED38348.1 hypothetical protein SAMN05428954_0200 [Streptomyces sp. 2112.3]
MRTRSIALSSVAAATALLGVAGTAAAADSTPAPSASANSAKTRTGDGAQALCKRAPKIDKRLHRALHRLQGKAGVRGSVARLEKRAEKAKAAGHTEIATFLNHKLAHRTSLVPTLQQRQKDLAKVATWCRSHHNTTSS